MKMQIKEFAKISGVSVRTLHYYDEIGLLKPAFVDGQNGYRFYDEASLERMQEILFCRELDFPLKSITEILASPNYDKQKALAEQKRLLTLKKDRLERLIVALEQAEKGEITMHIPHDLIGGAHDHEHSHTHTHEHPHDHDHLHGEGHSHEHSHECSHDCHSCGSACQHTPMEELMALMKYMVGHNASHAKELADLAGQLEKLGNRMAYEQVMAAVSDFEKGNMRLSMVLASLDVK